MFGNRASAEVPVGAGVPFSCKSSRMGSCQIRARTLRDCGVLNRLDDGFLDSVGSSRVFKGRRDSREQLAERVLHALARPIGVFGSCEFVRVDGECDRWVCMAKHA